MRRSAADDHSSLPASASLSTSKLSIRQQLILKATSGQVAQASEVDTYLTDPKQPGERQILEFWSLSDKRYPVLTRVAKDVLAIMSSSVPSESAFSTSSQYITDLRNRLEPEAIQAMMCLRSCSSVFEYASALLNED